MSFVRVVGAARELTAEEATVAVTVARIHKGDAADLLKTLSKVIPLQLYQLEHLKRIRHSQEEGVADSVLEIVVCPSKDAGGIPAAVGERLGSTREVRVARYPPSTREEFSSWGSLWPLNYRPRGQEGPPGAVSPADCALFEAHLDAVRREDAAMRVLTGRDGMGAIIVNPRNGKVVATSSGGLDTLAAELGGRERALRYPLLSPAVLCVGMLAAALRGGGQAGSPDVPISQYLCTGLDLYASTEPDAFSAMALVHSRMRRVVYWARDSSRGCLGSRADIHLIKSLNHHYEVYACAEAEVEAKWAADERT